MCDNSVHAAGKDVAVNGGEPLQAACALGETTAAAAAAAASGQPAQATAGSPAVTAASKKQKKNKGKRHKDALANMSDDELLEYHASLRKQHELEQAAAAAAVVVASSSTPHAARARAGGIDTDNSQLAAPTVASAAPEAAQEAPRAARSLATLSRTTRCRLLLAVQLQHGPTVRNRVATLCAPLLEVNRGVFVRALHVRSALEPLHMRELLSSYSNLRALSVADARTLPRDFAQLLLRRPLVPLEQMANAERSREQVEQHWARVEAERNEPVRDCIRLLRAMFEDTDAPQAAAEAGESAVASDGAGVHSGDAAAAEKRVYINPIVELRLEHNDTVTSSDVRLATRHMPFLASLKLCRFAKVTDACFLYELPLPQQILCIDLSHNSALRSTPIALNRQVYARAASQRRSAHTAAVALLSTGTTTGTPPPPPPWPYIDDEQFDRRCGAEAGADAEAEPGAGTEAGAMPDAEAAHGTEGEPQLTFDYMRAFALFSNLSALSLRQCTSLDAATTLRLVGGNSPHLRSLDLHSCTWLCDEHMVYVRNMPRLERLVIANCAQLTRDALFVLCYTTTATLRRIRANQQHIANLCPAASARPAVGGADGRSGGGDDEDEAAELDDRILDFFGRYGADCRTDMCAFARHSVLRTLDILERNIADGLSPLAHVDASYCMRMHGVDVRLFSALPLLDTLVLDGCSLFADHYGIDQMFARHYVAAAAATASTGVSSPSPAASAEQQLVRKFADTRCFETQFGADWRPNDIAARTVSTRACTITAKRELCDGEQRSVAYGAPVCSEAERREVCAAFKMLWAKHTPHATALHCGGAALTGNAMSYAVYWASPALRKLDITGSGNADSALAAFVRMCIAKAATDTSASGTTVAAPAAAAAAAGLPPLAELVVANCRTLSDDVLASVLDTFAGTLRALDAHGCTALSDAAFANVARCTKLVDVDVGACTGLTGYFLRLISGTARGVRQSGNAATATDHVAGHKTGCGEGADDATAVQERQKLAAPVGARAPPIADSSLLERSSAETERASQAAPPPPPVPPIERLNITQLPARENQIVNALKHCERLVFVTFDECAHVNDLVLATLAAKLPRIRGFAVRRTPKVTSEGIFYLLHNTGGGLQIVE